MVEVTVSEELGKRIEEVREKVKKANENVTEDKKLGNRTNFALDYLYCFRDMGQLIQAVQDLGKLFSWLHLRIIDFVTHLFTFCPCFRHFNASFFRLLRSVDFRRASVPARPPRPHTALQPLCSTYGRCIVISGHTYKLGQIRQSKVLDVRNFECHKSRLNYHRLGSYLPREVLGDIHERLLYSLDLDKDGTKLQGGNVMRDISQVCKSYFSNELPSVHKFILVHELKFSSSSSHGCKN